MTGPEHYREAELLLEAAARSFKAGWPDNAAAQAALAHAHATLASAAATVSDWVGKTEESRLTDWAEVTS